jgi:hypothetical protein
MHSYHNMNYSQKVNYSHKMNHSQKVNYSHKMNHSQKNDYNHVIIKIQDYMLTGKLLVNSIKYKSIDSDKNKNKK